MVLLTEAVHIRKLRSEDARKFAEAFAKQGWNKPETLFEAYFAQQERGERQVFVAEIEREPVGYVCLLRCAPGGPFKDKGIPCVSDFNVLERWQGKGVGNQLMDAVERAALAGSDSVCLGVGMHSGYGRAQRIYIKRGYVPDGSGLWYRDSLLAQGAPCNNDDDLVLYLVKAR